jgi:cell wall-associated NlpC family hydrolase
MNRQAIIDAALRHEGTPWVHQGRLPGVALDCLGLLVVVARELGFVPQDFDESGYSRFPDGVSLPDGLARYLVPINRSAIAPGDVVSMTFDQFPQHVGIVIPYKHGNALAMVHASSRAGKVERTRLMFNDKMRFTGAYSFPGVGAWVN